MVWVMSDELTAGVVLATILEGLDFLRGVS